MKRLTWKIKWKNNMKYLCEQYYFKWIKTSDTFNQVRQRKKIYLKNNKLKISGMRI